MSGISIKERLRRFFKPTEEEKAEALAERAINMYSQKDDRRYALYQLRQIGTAYCAQLMMRRFLRNCENSTVDFDEKELCSDYLVEMGEISIDPIKEFLRQNDKEFNWPFRSLKMLISEEEIIVFLIELLNDIGPDYVRDPERKEQLMLTAKSYSDEGLARALLPYLGDDNETIRFVACDTAVAHGYDFDIEALSKRLLVEESQRVLTHILEAFKNQGWVVPVEDREALVSVLTSGYQLDKSGHIV